MEISDALPGADRRAAPPPSRLQRPDTDDFPEDRLYARLASEDEEAAHSRYNALIRLLVSFERAAELAMATSLDREDVQAMLSEKLVDPRKLFQFSEQIEEQLYRFPAVNAAGLRKAVTELQYRHP